MRAVMTEARVRYIQARLPRWLGSFTRWSVVVVSTGPRWVPRYVRKLPLRLACWLTSVWVRALL
jgi:hypothetical protein